MEKTICELFAGVGGFRLGFEKLKSDWRTVWFSQWEPGAKTQWAHDCYVSHFGDCADINGELHTGEDIGTVDKNNIPDHSVLVGGFPCQDYSVAHTLASSKGIEGKKGVLWWQIRNTMIAKRPAFCIFENVDRLLKSPAKQRGRDFGVILSCLAELDYSAEWRVVNAANYGAAQRRKRVFVFAYRNDTNYAHACDMISERELVLQCGLMAKAFPIETVGLERVATLAKDPVDVSESFRFDFRAAGYMSRHKVWTADVREISEKSKNLGEILLPAEDEKYFIRDSTRRAKWEYLKGAKKIARKASNGHEYVFSEGPVAFPDSWEKPARTMLTSESTLNRSSHVVEDPATRELRTLLPIEAERIQGFGDNWTATGMPERMRFFCMGNALVVDMVTRMGKILDRIIEKE